MVYLVHLGEMLFAHVKTFHLRVKFIGIVYGLRSGGRGGGTGGDGEDENCFQFHDLSSCGCIDRQTF